MSEPYHFPMEFSGGLAGKMVAEVVRSGNRGRIRERERGVFVRKMKRKEKRREEPVKGIRR